MLTTKELSDESYWIKDDKLGKIEDFIVDFCKGRIKGVVIRDCYDNYIYINTLDILDNNRENIGGGIVKYVDGMHFSDILNMQVVDRKGDLLGVVEEAILDEFYNIKAIVISNKDKEKEIILFKDLVLGDSFIMLYSDHNKLKVIKERRELTNEDITTSY